MKVRLNLATKPLETHRRFLAGASLLAFAGSVVFLGLGWHVYSVRKVNAEVRDRNQRIAAEMQQLQQQRAELEKFFARPENARLSDRAAFLNTLIDARSFNWTQMFMDLEHVLPGGVRVTSIEPQQEKGQVHLKLVVDTSNEQAKLNFLKALEGSKVFSHIELITEKAPSGAAPGAAIGDEKTVELNTVYSRI
jgi:type IV pilus assembly protein PilN